MSPPTMRLHGGWTLTQSTPGLWAGPQAIDAAAEWVPAIVPGTVGAALRTAGRWQPDDDVGFDAFDFWYRGAVTGEGPAILRFDGLATIAEVFLDDRLVARSDNMFVALEAAVTLVGTHALTLCFRSLDGHLATRKGRARWLPRLVRPPALRFARTLLLGHVPGWGPPIHAVGPWRGLALLEATALRIVETRIAARLVDGAGILDLAVRFSAPVSGWVVVSIGAIDFTLVESDDSWLRGSITVPDADPWWPHTHGRPALYPLVVYAGGESFPLAPVGFRTITVDRDIDGKGFGLVVNDVPVFCRGACWTTADPVALPFTRADYEPLLHLMRAAGLNMVRIGGTMGYEGDAFYRLCDEIGLLVWQDFAFANFDYPAGEPAFVASVDVEARQFLGRLQGQPCLAVLCGASEVAQQAAMMGLPAALWSNAIFDAVLPAAAATLRPDVPYLAHSPSGGSLPFVADEGVSHYYGVSAHCRPVEEARRAGVRFSAESLGLANVPDDAPFILEPDAPAIRHLDHVERVPHESAASWAFENIRNHYCETLYGVDVAALRAADEEHFLALARATSAELIEATFAEWRRAGSPTRGALVWFWRDLAPGAGWGMIDAVNSPKAAYYGLLRACRSVTAILTDENLNGLRVTLINETTAPRRVRLSLRCLRESATAVMDATRDLDLPPRASVAIEATDLWGGFFDTTYAYRFGEPAHDVTVARITDTWTGTFLADAFHFPLGRGHARADLGLGASVHRNGSGWAVTLATKRLAQSVRIACPPYRPAENWLHLAPGADRTIDLIGPSAAGAPQGWVEAVNGKGPIPLLPG